MCLILKKKPSKESNCRKEGCCCTVTHHWVAGLEDLPKQDGTPTLRIRLSERTEAAGVSDIRTVHTLNTQTYTMVLNGNFCSRLSSKVLFIVICWLRKCLRRLTNPLILIHQLLFFLVFCHERCITPFCVGTC